MYKSQLEPPSENFVETQIFVENIFDTVKKAREAKAARSLAESKLASYDYSFDFSPSKRKKARKSVKNKVNKNNNNNNNNSSSSGSSKSTPTKKKQRKPRTPKDEKKKKQPQTPNKTPRKYTKRAKVIKPQNDIDDEEAAFILSSISQRSFDSFYNRLNGSSNNVLIPLETTTTTTAVDAVQKPIDHITAYHHVLLDHNYWLSEPTPPTIQQPAPEIPQTPTSVSISDNSMNLLFTVASHELKCTTSVASATTSTKVEVNNNKLPPLDMHCDTSPKLIADNAVKKRWLRQATTESISPVITPPETSPNDMKTPLKKRRVVREIDDNEIKFTAVETDMSKIDQTSSNASLIINNNNNNSFSNNVNNQAINNMIMTPMVNDVIKVEEQQPVNMIKREISSEILPYAVDKLKEIHEKIEMEFGRKAVKCEQKSVIQTTSVIKNSSSILCESLTKNYHHDVVMKSPERGVIFDGRIQDHNGIKIEPIDTTLHPPMHQLYTLKSESFDTKPQLSKLNSSSPIASGKIQFVGEGFQNIITSPTSIRNNNQIGVLKSPSNVNILTNPYQYPIDHKFNDANVQIIYNNDVKSEPQQIVHESIFKIDNNVYKIIENVPQNNNFNHFKMNNENFMKVNDQIVNSMQQTVDHGYQKKADGGKKPKKLLKNAAKNALKKKKATKAAKKPKKSPQKKVKKVKMPKSPSKSAKKKSPVKIDKEFIKNFTDIEDIPLKIRQNLSNSFKFEDVLGKKDEATEINPELAKSPLKSSPCEINLLPHSSQNHCENNLLIKSPSKSISECENPLKVSLEMNLSSSIDSEMNKKLASSCENSKVNTQIVNASTASVENSLKSTISVVEATNVNTESQKSMSDAQNSIKTLESVNVINNLIKNLHENNEKSEIEVKIHQNEALSDQKEVIKHHNESLRHQNELKIHPVEQLKHSNESTMISSDKMKHQNDLKMQTKEHLKDQSEKPLKSSNELSKISIECSKHIIDELKHSNESLKLQSDNLKHPVEQFKHQADSLKHPSVILATSSDFNKHSNQKSKTNSESIESSEQNHDLKHSHDSKNDLHKQHHEKAKISNELNEQKQGKIRHCSESAKSTCEIDKRPRTISESNKNHVEMSKIHSNAQDFIKSNDNLMKSNEIKKNSNSLIENAKVSNELNKSEHNLMQNSTITIQNVNNSHDSLINDKNSTEVNKISSEIAKNTPISIESNNKQVLNSHESNKITKIPQQESISHQQISNEPQKHSKSSKLKKKLNENSKNDALKFVRESGIMLDSVKMKEISESLIFANESTRIPNNSNTHLPEKQNLTQKSSSSSSLSNLSSITSSPIEDSAELSIKNTDENTKMLAELDKIHQSSSESSFSSVNSSIDAQKPQEINQQVASILEKVISRTLIKDIIEEKSDQEVPSLETLQDDDEDDTQYRECVEEFHKDTLEKLMQANKRFCRENFVHNPFRSHYEHQQPRRYDYDDHRKPLKASLSFESQYHQHHPPAQFNRSISEAYDPRRERWCANGSYENRNYGSFHYDKIHHREHMTTTYSMYRAQKASQIDNHHSRWSSNQQPTVWNQEPSVVQPTVVYSAPPPPVVDVVIPPVQQQPQPIIAPTPCEVVSPQAEALKNATSDAFGGFLKEKLTAGAAMLPKTKTASSDPRLNPALVVDAKKEEPATPKKKLSLDQYRKRKSLTSVTSISDDTTNSKSPSPTSSLPPAFDPSIAEAAATG